MSAAAGYRILFFAGCAASISGRMLLNRMRNALEYRLRLQALNEFIYPEKENISATDVGGVKLKMDNDICKLSECLQEQFGKFEVKIILLVFSAVYLFVLNWQLALLGVIAIPITIWIDFIISRKENILNEKNRQNDSDMTSWLHCVLNGWRQIKMFGQEKSQARKYVRFQHKYALHNAKWINYWVTRVLIVYYHLSTDSMTALSAYQASMQSDMPIYLRAMSWNRRTVERKEPEYVPGIHKMELKEINFGYSSESPDLLKI